MQNIPERIFLNISEEDMANYDDFTKLESESENAVTWCQAPIYNTDVEYIRKQSPWISVNERLPEEDEYIIIMCKHGAIFNGTYCNGVWFCMDGYIHDTYNGNPIYSSMCSIPPLWKPIAWMPIPKFNE